MFWKNSHFQNAFFIAGRQHTPDGAWLALKRQLDERELTLRVAQAGLQKRYAKLNILNRKIWWCEFFLQKDWANIFKAEMAEIMAHAVDDDALFGGMASEIAMLKAMMKEIEPHRKYSHLPDNDAAQECQREYWLYELVERAENFLITEGRIPHDHFATMRAHPDYKAIIAPEVENLYIAMREGKLSLANASKLSDSIQLEVGRELPKLLESEQEV